jgi:hypothetical protein
MTDQLPAPQLTQVYRLEAALGDPLDVGVVSQRRAPRKRRGPRTARQRRRRQRKRIRLPHLHPIETASRDLDWLNKGVFISVAGRRPGGVTYETYLVA